MLELRELWKTFNAGTVNEKQALRGVSLTLQDGDFCTVIGGNGAGKSTMLNAVAGTFPVDSGSIVIGGTDVTRLPEHKRAKFIGRVFQDPMMGTAPTMQIEENLALAPAAASAAGWAGASPRRSGPNTGTCWQTWIWVWRTASPARWACSPAASARR